MKLTEKDLMVIEGLLTGGEGTVTLRMALAQNLLDDLREATEAATDYAAKVQYVVDWAASSGLLDDRGVFTFPDGDSWEAKRKAGS